MIKISNKIIDKTIKYLNDNYSTKEDVYIKIAEGFEVVQDPTTGECGFGALDTKYKIICIPSLMEEEELIRTIAHEYRHFMQMCDGATTEEDFDEDDAENFADMILKEMESNNDKL